MSASNPLQKLAEQGQSVWLDFISRDLLTSGELERMIAEDNVTGMTSNPTIFQKAIADGDQYDTQIRDLLADGIDDPNDIFLALAVTDIQRAADILRPVHERSGGADGFVSLELPPESAHSTERSATLALEYARRVDRPNLMGKIPATSWTRRRWWGGTPSTPCHRPPSSPSATTASSRAARSTPTTPARTASWTSWPRPASTWTVSPPTCSPPA